MRQGRRIWVAVRLISPTATVESERTKHQTTDNHAHKHTTLKHTLTQTKYCKRNTSNEIHRAPSTRRAAPQSTGSAPASTPWGEPQLPQILGGPRTRHLRQNRPAKSRAVHRQALRPPLIAYTWLYPDRRARLRYQAFSWRPTIIVSPCRSESARLAPPLRHQTATCATRYAS